jgi:hypothetical protein
MLINKRFQGLLVVMTAVIASSLAYAQDRPDHTTALSQINTLISNDDGALAGGSVLFQLAWKDSGGSSRDFRITNLKYANGYQQDANNYIVDATYTRTFKVSLSGIFQKSWADDPLLPAALIWGHFESGDSFDESAKFLFLRTEKGWILQGYEGGFSVVTSHMEHQAREAIQKQKDEVQRQKDAVQGQKDAVQGLIDVKNACASSQQVKIHDDYRIGRLEDASGGMQRDDKQYGIVPNNGTVVGCLPDIIYKDKMLGYVQNPPRAFCHIQFQYDQFRFVDKIGSKLVSGYYQCEFLSVVK